MEQVIVILREYANGILAAYGGCMLVLLLVTLHRIKRMEKHMRKLLESATNTDVVVARDVSKQEMSQEETVECKNQVADVTASSGKNDMQERPEELIDAVLGEIF